MTVRMTWWKWKKRNCQFFVQKNKYQKGNFGFIEIRGQMVSLMGVSDSFEGGQLVRDK